MANVSNEEFSRWMNEQANFRSRLEVRMGEQQVQVMAILTEIKDHLAELNGRTRKNSEAIAVMERDLDAVKSEDREIEKIVHSIKEDGCSQYHAHVNVLRETATMAVDAWSPRKKAAVGGALVGTGVVIWPFLTEVAKVVSAVISHTQGAR